MFDADKIQAAIGYKFKNDDLLKRAFTHSSYANENCEEDNERLEFLGDSILNFAVAEYLFGIGEGADEGRLTKQRSALVSEQPLSRIAKSLGFEDSIFTCNKFNISSVIKRSIPHLLIFFYKIC